MPAAATTVRLGRVAPDGISPSVYVLVERGVERRPEVARTLRGEIAFRFDEGFAPVRVVFAVGEVLVEDGTGEPDLVISGPLPDIVQLAAAPNLGGVPKPTTRQGRQAIARVIGGRVRIDGPKALARQVLRLLEI